jgi:hypothetical protein
MKFLPTNDPHGEHSHATKLYKVINANGVIGLVAKETTGKWAVYDVTGFKNAYGGRGLPYVYPTRAAAAEVVLTVWTDTPREPTPRERRDAALSRIYTAFGINLRNLTATDAEELADGLEASIKVTSTTLYAADVHAMPVPGEAKLGALLKFAIRRAAEANGHPLPTREEVPA